MSYKSSKDRKNKREKLLLANKCPNCGRDKSLVKIWTNRKCAFCHLKEKFGFTGTNEEAIKIINNLLKKQNYKCALTGRDLKKNKYHIDHILPKSTHPKLASDPKNWQIVVAQVNLFKSDMSIKELIKLSRDIIKWADRK
jgi:hypothetical protein